MSTDETPAPRTRAEARAAREAAERAVASAEAAVEDGSVDRDGDSTSTPPRFTPDCTERDAEHRVSHVGTPVEPASVPDPYPPAAEHRSDEEYRPDEERGPDEESPSDSQLAPPSDPAADAKRPAGLRDRRFLVTLGGVLGILTLAVAGLGAVSLTQGPRLTSVQVDPAHGIESSGSRIVLTANQSLAAIEPAQITVEPAVPFTVDAAGRGVGIRFTVPLDDETTYSVRVADVVAAGGGPAATLDTTFATPASQIFLLRRDTAAADTIFRTDLTGENAVPVFSADRINDFRATWTRLVVSVEEDNGSRLLVMDRDGSDQRELLLPGEGYVGALQVSDRGGLVGYSYSDRELSDTQGRASVLVTQPLNGTGDPQVVEVAGAEVRVFTWRFVPNSAAALFIDFHSALSLLDRSTDAGVQSLGLAANIHGISRGTYTAIVEHLDGSVVELNLADGSEQPLALSTLDYAPATTITPFPGGTLRHVVARDGAGVPSGQAIIRVDDAGVTSPLFEVGSTDAILQACASPSGQYAAVVIARQLADNPYDQMLLPLPQRLETHLKDLATGDEIVALTGFDASWCQTAPQF